MAGGCFGVGLVALLEARGAQAAETGAHAPSFDALLTADVAVLVPMALVVAFFLAAFAIYVEPSRPLTIGEHVARLRAEPVLTRSRTAAMAPLAIVTAFAWTLAIAHLGRHVLGDGTPAAAGAELATLAIVSLIAMVATALALMPPLRRALAAGAAKSPRLIDPLTTGLVGFVIVALALGVGVMLGDNGGNGPTPLSIFGVLKRNELDLRPVVNLLAIAACAWLAQLALGQKPRVVQGVVAALCVVGALVVHVRQASALNEVPAVTRSIERNAPLGKIGLAVIRKMNDHDHDGYSAKFGGGDCNDRDKSVNPGAIDAPGNGVDEDCSGADTPAPPPAPIASAAPPDAGPPKPVIDKPMNLILITVDTLRTNVGFMGYPKPTSPNLDKLAAKSTIFDRAYAMASYTGKSIGPLLAGKYPSETLRDGGHFNKYSPDNVLITERLKAAGIRTMGAASHWYFKPSFGLTQGMDDWDTSSIPKDGQGESDTSITSPQVTDTAITLLGKPENTSGRFFMWVHYFDPHAEFMPHKDAPPELKPDDQKPGWGLRWMYDGEIWFTDKHLGRLLDYVASQPWGENTIIAVTADHGEMIVEHNMTYHGFEVWEQLVHVPLVIYMPGAVPHHVTAKRGHVDVVPTLLELMGQTLPPRPELSGDSMITDVFAKAGDTFEERDVYIDMPQGPNNGMRHALLHGTSPGMKLIHIQGNQYQLFDLAKDPWETDDLSSDKALLAPMVAAFQAKKATLKEIYVRPDEPGH